MLGVAQQPDCQMGGQHWAGDASHMTLLALQQLAQEGGSSRLEVGAGQQAGCLCDEPAAGNTPQGWPLCVCSRSLCTATALH